MPDWRRRLTQPLTVRDGPTLRTLDDTRPYVLALPADLQEWNAWQHAARLMLEAAGAALIWLLGAGILQIIKSIELAEMKSTVAEF
jgi:hypothetical protein